jgi:hypothetical protein
MVQILMRCGADPFLEKGKNTDDTPYRYAAQVDDQGKMFYWINSELEQNRLNNFYLLDPQLIKKEQLEILQDWENAMSEFMYILNDYALKYAENKKTNLLYQFFFGQEPDRPKELAKYHRLARQCGSTIEIDGLKKGANEVLEHSKRGLMWGSVLYKKVEKFLSFLTAIMDMKELQKARDKYLVAKEKAKENEVLRREVETLKAQLQAQNEQFQAKINVMEEQQKARALEMEEQQKAHALATKEQQKAFKKALKSKEERHKSDMQEHKSDLQEIRKENEELRIQQKKMMGLIDFLMESQKNSSSQNNYGSQHNQGEGGSQHNQGENDSQHGQPPPRQSSPNQSRFFPGSTNAEDNPQVEPENRESSSSKKQDTKEEHSKSL